MQVPLCIYFLQVRNCKSVIMQELESALAQQAPPQTQDDPTLHELPPLVIDGIPTPVEKMTQVSGFSTFFFWKSARET